MKRENKIKIWVSSFDLFTKKKKYYTFIMFNGNTEREKEKQNNTST